jgi:long-chain fatty acid transport protein
LLWSIALGTVLLAAGPAHATNGYFSEGYSTINEGMAGASIAYPRDTLAIASNPAGLISVGDRLDIGVEWFSPDRSASITGNAFGPNQTFDGDGLENFYIPSIGYSHLLTPDLALGIAAYGNGGMNTHYGENPYARFGAKGDAGVNLEQLFVSPTLAYQVAPGHSVGLSVNIAYQQFSAHGIGAFAPFSADPGALSDRGTDHAFGSGVRLGYLGKLTPELSLGAFWQSKTYSDSFDKYRGLFADAGSFDIPSSYGVGLAYAVTPALDVAVDVTRIDYSDIPSVGNGLAQLFQGQAFGSSAGPGFGWRDVTTVKLGANYRLSPEWEVRGGFSYNTQPIPTDQTFLNILAPGVVQYHLTLGASWAIPGGPELSAFGLYAPTTTVNGHGSIPAGFPPGGFGGGEANISLSETAIGLSAGWKLD